MLIQLITSENDAGRPGARAGQGPSQLLASGLTRRLEEAGHRVEVVPVAPRDPFPSEITSAFSTAAALAQQVRAASRQRRFPLVLAGNCIASLGVIAGLRPSRRGLIWIDPVGDLERPQTTRTGELDRMALATILGHAWPEMTARVPGFTPVASEQLLLIGGDEMEPNEGRWAEELALAQVSFDEVRRDPGATASSMEQLKETTDRLHLHIDLRSVVASSARGSKGLSPTDLLGLVRQVKSGAPLASATLASYDPARDPTGERGEAALVIIDALVTP